MSVVRQDHSYGGPSEGSENSANVNPEGIREDDVNNEVQLNEGDSETNVNLNDANLNDQISIEEWTAIEMVKMNKELTAVEMNELDKETRSIEENVETVKITKDTGNIEVNALQEYQESIDAAHNFTDCKAVIEMHGNNVKQSKNEILSNHVNSPFQSLIAASEMASVADSLLNDPRNSKTSDPSKDEASEVSMVSNVENGEKYFCGVCLKEFGAMIELHEHMVNIEKVKSYKYSIETRTADVDNTSRSGKDKSTTQQPESVKKRGRQRKQDASCTSTIADRDTSKEQPKSTIKKNKKQKIDLDEESRGYSFSGVKETGGLIKQPLMKFEKTIENKSEDSAFFDPIKHSYGTRRRSFLDLKEQGAVLTPDKTKSRKLVKNMRGNHVNLKQSTPKGQPGKIKEEPTDDGNVDLVTEDVHGKQNDGECEISSSLDSDVEDISNQTHSKVEKYERVKPDGTIEVIDDNQSMNNKENLSVESECDYNANEEDSDDAEYEPDKDTNGGKKKEKRNRRSYSKKRVDCQVCGKTFRSCMIERHMVKHSNSRDWQCDICLKYYKTKLQCYDHKRKTHCDLKLFKCHTCGKELKNKYSAEKHKTLHLLRAEEPEIEQLDLVVIKEEKPDETVTDNRSSEQDVDKENANSDEKNHLDSNEDCELKNLDSVNDGAEEANTEGSSNTDTIMLVDDNMDTFPCNKCEGIFSSKADLTAHKAKEHVKPKLHSCKSCPKVFKKLCRLKDHINSEHEHKTFSCFICNVVLNTERNLLAHKARHLSESDPYYSEENKKAIQEEHKERMMKKVTPKFVMCSICGKEIFAKRFLRHMNSHNTSRDYECYICHKRYTTQRYVRDHIVKAHGTKTSFCDICGRTFKGTQYLDKHKQTHGPRDKICNICGKGFTTDFYLKVHMVTHAGSKQHKCSLCDAAFKHKPRLDIHMMERHSQGQDRPCKHCGALFPSRQKARLHERKVHEGYMTQSRSKRGSVMRQKVKPIQADGEGVHYRMMMPSINFKQSETEESVEQIIEIPENSQQCQLMILPNGIIKVLNVVEGEDETNMSSQPAVESPNDNYTIQYVTEDGGQVTGEGDPNVQYIEVDESEFKLMTEGNDTQVVEIIENI